MPRTVEPLIDVREHETFLEDKATVERALAHAREFAGEDGFKDRKEAGEAADAIKALGNARRDAEARKLGITAEWRATTNAVNTQYKELLAPLGAAEQALKDKGLAFKKQEEARAQEEQRQREAEQNRIAEQAAQEAQEAAELAAEDEDPELQKLADEARQDAAAAAAAPPPRPIAPPKQMRGSFASLGSRTVYRFEVVDAGVIPDRLKVLSDKAAQDEIDAEARAAKAEKRDFKLEIPGIRIYPKEIPVSR